MKNMNTKSEATLGQDEIILKNKRPGCGKLPDLPFKFAPAANMRIKFELI
jgi:hypothetical protein